MKIANCFQRHYLLHVVFLRDLFLDHYFLLFTLLHSVIQTLNLDHHLYAGDIQIYLSLATLDTNCSLNQLKDYQNVFHWMINSKLKLNAKKTEFLIIGTQKQRVKLDCFLTTPMAMLSQIFRIGHLSTEFRSHL